jgi:LysR family hydrogen peroxide-inducible transcriptional activator
MTLTELRYVVALYDTGHFRNAAEQCHVSQPTLSIAVKKLEGELGVILFERSRSQLTPTPTGEQIVAQARVVLRESQQLIQLAQLGKDPLGSVLSVGAIFTVGPYLFPRLVGRLQHSAPEMPLYIEENYTANLRGKLRSGALDAVFIALPFTEPDVLTRPVFEEPFVVVMPPDHPLASSEKVKASALADHRVILLGEGHCFRDQVLEACPGLRESISENQNGGRAVLDGSSLETLKHMVASGLGITVLPASAANLGQYEGGDLVVRHFQGPAPTRTVALAWRASYPRHRVIDVLTEALRDQAG